LTLAAIFRFKGAIRFADIAETTSADRAASRLPRARRSTPDSAIAPSGAKPLGDEVAAVTVS